MTKEEFLAGRQFSYIGNTAPVMIKQHDRSLPFKYTGNFTRLQQRVLWFNGKIERLIDELEKEAWKVEAGDDGFVALHPAFGRIPIGYGECELIKEVSHG